MPTPEKHALLSASSAHRWLRCTRSPRLEEQLPENTSRYAEAGRVAHAIAELKLRKKFIEGMGPKKFNVALKALQSDEYYDQGMMASTDTYVDYISGIVHSFPSNPYIAVEVRVDYSRYVPEGFGTSDCVIIHGSDLYIIDYKNGAGKPVYAENNPQMRLYALGALEQYLTFYDIRTIHMAIVQPNLDSITEDAISRDDLINWGVFEVRPKAELAFSGEGEFCAGDWCQFCRARGQCKAQAQQALAEFKEPLPIPGILTGAELADILPKLPVLKKWVEQVEDATLTRMLAGEAVPGYKVVEGRSVRQFDDQEAAFAAITAAGYDEALLYERKPLTLAAAEKLIGKAKFAEIAGAHILTPPGKPTIAPESDKREPYNPRTTAAEDFN